VKQQVAGRSVQLRQQAGRQPSRQQAVLSGCMFHGCGTASKARGGDLNGWQTFVCAEVGIPCMHCSSGLITGAVAASCHAGSKRRQVCWLLCNRVLLIYMNTWQLSLGMGACA
jgi:hypothetical protein